MLLRQVVGESMLPCLKPGMVILALRLKPRIGDVVIARQAGLEVVKRISKLTDEGVYLTGDNQKNSIDSSIYGIIKWSEVLGRVIVRLPSSSPFNISRSLDQPNLP